MIVRAAAASAVGRLRMVDDAAWPDPAEDQPHQLPSCRDISWLRQEKSQSASTSFSLSMCKSQPAHEKPSSDPQFQCCHYGFITKNNNFQIINTSHCLFKLRSFALQHWLLCLIRLTRCVSKPGILAWNALLRTSTSWTQNRSFLCKHTDGQTDRQPATGEEDPRSTSTPHARDFWLTAPITFLK